MFLYLLEYPDIFTPSVPDVYHHLVFIENSLLATFLVPPKLISDHDAVDFEYDDVECQLFHQREILLYECFQQKGKQVVTCHVVNI